MAGSGGSVCITDHLAAVVDIVGLAGCAAERAQIGDDTGLPEGGMATRSARHLAGVVNGRSAQGAEIDNRVTHQATIFQGFQKQPARRQLVVKSPLSDPCRAAALGVGFQVCQQRGEPHGFPFHSRDRSALQ